MSAAIGSRITNGSFEGASLYNVPHMYYSCWNETVLAIFCKP